MPSRSPARYLAPLALALAFIAVMMVVNGSGDGKDGGSATQTRSTTATTPKTTRPKKTRQVKTYTVKPGDVLSAIAEKTGVPLDRLLELNPDLDPQELRAGQKIRLRR